MGSRSKVFAGAHEYMPTCRCGMFQMCIGLKRDRLVASLSGPLSSHSVAAIFVALHVRTRVTTTTKSRNFSPYRNSQLQRPLASETHCWHVMGPASWKSATLQHFGPTSCVPVMETCSQQPTGLDHVDALKTGVVDLPSPTLRWLMGH